MEATTVLAAIFPIVFAIVVGQLMTLTVRWRLETGARLRSPRHLPPAEPWAAPRFPSTPCRLDGFTSCLCFSGRAVYAADVGHEVARSETEELGTANKMMFSTSFSTKVLGATR
ncbi:hypothetical protein ACKVWH_007995 [Pyricularia oryzae]